MKVQRGSRGVPPLFL